MIGFYIKKTFFDGWDNILQLIILNVLVLAIAFAGFFLLGFTATLLPISIGVFVVFSCLLGIAFLTVSSMMYRIADFRSFKISDCIEAIKKTWLHGIFYTLVWFVLIVLFRTAIPFYSSMGNLFGFALTVILFWINVIVALSIQWFLPIRTQLDPSFFKSMKKSFIIFFDNPLFSLVVFIHTLITAVVSSFTLSTIPSVILVQNEAFRILLYKYDWFDTTDMDLQEARKNIPWDDLIADDVESLGPRTLKNFIFPWKE